MVEEPDIIKQLREAEKRGVFKSAIHQPIESVTETRQGYDDSKDSFFVNASLIDDQKDENSEYFEEESIYRQVIELSPDGIFIVDLKGIVQYCNISAVRLTGYSKEEVIGKDFSKLFATCEQKKLKTYLDKVHLVLCGKSVTPFEIKFQKKDGKEFTAEIMGGPLEKNNKKFGMQFIVHDISSKKLQDDSIGGSEKELRDFFDNANDLIQSVDANGFFKFVNKKWKEAMEYSDEEIKKLHFTDILREDYISHCETIFKRLPQGESFTNIDVVFKTKSGGDVFVNGNINAYVVDGELITTYGIFRDMTEYRYAFEELEKSKRKLRESEQMLKEAQEIAKMGRWDFDHAENRLTWTDTIYDIFELERDSFNGSYEAFLDLVHPDDEKLVNNAWIESLSDKKPYEIEHRLLLKDGQIKWVSEQCRTEFDEKGKPVHSVGIVQDITERKQAEGMMKALLDGSPIPQFVIDKDHKIMHWNSTLETYTGIEAKDAIGTNHQWKAFYNQERPCLVDLLVDGKSEKIRELYKGKYEKSRLIDGAIEATDFFANINGGIWLYFIAAPLYDAKGNIIGGVETLIDITDQKRIEEDLVEERKRLNFILDITKTRIDIIDTKYNIKYVDEGWQKIYGDPSGRKCYEYFMGLSEPCQQCGIPKALEKKEVIIYEEKLPRENNRIIEVHTIPFQDSNGCWLVAEFNVDITDRKKNEEKLHRQVGISTLLNEIIRIGIEPKDLLSYLKRTLDILLEKLDYDGGGVYLVDKNKRSASIACSKNIPEEFLKRSGSIPIDGNPIYTKLFRNNDLVILDDYAERFPEQSALSGFNSVISIPISVEGAVVGALNLARIRKKAISKSDREVLRLVTSQMGLIWKRIQFEAELKHNINELKKWKKVTVGRELRMNELKKKIKELEERC
jgi:PAS domain S-box-containing protein